MAHCFANETQTITFEENISIDYFTIFWYENTLSLKLLFSYLTTNAYSGELTGRPNSQITVTNYLQVDKIHPSTIKILKDMYIKSYGTSFFGSSDMYVTLSLLLLFSLRQSSHY